MDATRYAGFRRSLHWLMALMLVGMVASGLAMTEMDWNDPELRPTVDALYTAHKWSGFAFLGLAALRIVSAFWSPAPALPGHVSAFERRVAGLTHTALYALLLIVPLLGWAATSAGGLLPEPLLGALAMPSLLAPYECPAEGWSFEAPGVALETACLSSAHLFDAHALAAFALIGLAGFHAAAALFHLLRADGVFRRMWG